MLAIWWTPLHRVAGRAVRERISPRLFQLLKKISAALVSYRAQLGTLALNLVLAIAENLLQIVNFYVIGRALGVRVPLLPFFAAIAVTALVRRLAMHVDARPLIGLPFDHHRRVGEQAGFHVGRHARPLEHRPQAVAGHARGWRMFRRRHRYDYASDNRRYDRAGYLKCSG